MISIAPMVFLHGASNALRWVCYIAVAADDGFFCLSIFLYSRRITFATSSSDECLTPIASMACVADAMTFS